MTPKLGEIRHLKTPTEQIPVKVLKVRTEGEFKHIYYGYLGEPFASIFTIYKGDKMIAPRFITIE